MKRMLKHKQFTLISLVVLSIGFSMFGALDSSALAFPKVYLADANTVVCPGGQIIQMDNQTCCPGTNRSTNSTTCFLDKYVNPTIQLLSAAVGLVAVVAIIIGAIEYITSGGDPQRAASGRNHITNALLGLFAFAFLYAFLQFLLPGGLFNGG